jgi:hypothetical protein
VDPGYRRESGKPNRKRKKTQEPDELIDVASATKGRHLISFGADLDWIHENASAYDGFGAVYLFPTLNAFLNGEPDQYRQAFGNPSTHFATPKYSGFIQDHWTLANRFTIDAGIRFDFEHLPTQFKQDTNDFAPRVGVAYSPSPTWALRAGFGIFFDRYLLAAVNRALERNGVQALEQVADGQAATQIFQSELGGSALIPIPSIRPTTFTADPNLQTSRSEIATAGTEHLITRNLTASATFLFARGVRLSRTRNVNLPPPVLLTPSNALSLGIPNPFPQQLGRLVFPPARLSSKFDDIYQWENHASSVYKGLSLYLNRRLANEVEFSGSYTISKAIDDASDFNEHESKANPSCCSPSGGVWGGVLLVRRTFDAQGTAAPGHFFFGRSYPSEDRVQRFSILYPRCCNAVTHLSLLLAGDLCNGTIAERHQQPGRASFCDLGAGFGD